MPEEICVNCLDDLQTAYKFRLNCENSEAILYTVVHCPSVDDDDNNDEQHLFQSKQANDDEQISEGEDVTSEKAVDSLITNIKTEDNYEELSSIIIDEQHLLQSKQANDDEHISKGEEDVISEKPVNPLINNIKTEDNYDELSSIIIETDNNDEHSFVNESLMNDDNILETLTYSTENNDETEMQEDCYEYEIYNVKPVRNKIIASRKLSTSINGNINDTNATTVEAKPMKVCVICGNEYKFNHSLESHMRRHRNDKPFQCRTCGKGFVIKFELNRHLRTHTGQKPYACKHCDRRFSDFGSRIKHERTHTGERPYSCEICHKSFTYSHVLSSHMSTHTGEKRFE